jgi:hypothetical protein
MLVQEIKCDLLELALSISDFLWFVVVGEVCEEAVASEKYK